jgi:HSP20 family protein
MNKKNALSSREDLFNQIVDTFFHEDFFAPITMSGNSFRVDLKENATSYVIKADLPGVKKEDISIRFANNYLTISARRNEDTKTEENNYLRRERRYGELNRSFYVGNVQNETIDAEFKDGVLTISLPKRENPPDSSQTISIR